MRIKQNGRETEQIHGAKTKAWWRSVGAGRISVIFLANPIDRSIDPSIHEVFCYYALKHIKNLFN